MSNADGPNYDASEMRFVVGELDELELVVERLRAQNDRLLAALAKIVELGHYPDESIARAAIDEARSS